MLSGMFKAEYIIYLWIYINVSCIFRTTESFKIWSAIIMINTEGKSLIMKLGPGLVNTKGLVVMKGSYITGPVNTQVNFKPWWWC
mgnify:CR=1 FL=1